jgi:hypothetical protein
MEADNPEGALDFAVRFGQRPDQTGMLDAPDLADDLAGVIEPDPDQAGAMERPTADDAYGDDGGAGR